MNVRLFPTLLALSASLFLLADQTVCGGQPTSDAPRAGFQVVELFAAIDSGDVEVFVVAPDSTEATLRVRNGADRPLAIRLPAALGARPVLAQFGPGGGAGVFGGNPGGAAGGLGGAGQGIGMGMPGGGRGMGPGVGGPFGAGAGPFGGGGGGAAFFNVLPGKTIKQELTAVCLEHGKPDPHRKMKYELVRIEELAPQKESVALLQALANGRVSQTVAQLAAWNLVNDKSWTDLASTPRISVRGRRTNRFSATQIHTAKQLVKTLKAAQRSKPIARTPIASAQSSSPSVAND